MNARRKAITPTVEVLTATKDGLRAFLLKVRKLNGMRAPSGRGPMTRVSGFGHIPMLQRLSSNGEEKPCVATGGGNLTLYVTSLIGSLNRGVNNNRVQEYWGTMLRGEWWFTPDPIVVTSDGAIINGQHRLLAVARLIESAEKGEAIPEPQFVVVWGVDKRAAILMDEARRTSVDRRDIAIRYAQSSERRAKGEEPPSDGR